MVKSRDGCGAVGEKRCQWRRKGWIVQCVKIGMGEWRALGEKGCWQ
ncbi:MULTISPECIES: hypothetical protein [unclassified Bartonella]